MGYPNHKHVWDIQITSICIRDVLWVAYSSPPGAPAALRALWRHRALVALFAPSFDTAMCSSSVSATDYAVCPAQTATAIG